MATLVVDVRSSRPSEENEVKLPSFSPEKRGFEEIHEGPSSRFMNHNPTNTKNLDSKGSLDSRKPVQIDSEKESFSESHYRNVQMERMKTAEHNPRNSDDDDYSIPTYLPAALAGGIGQDLKINSNTENSGEARLLNASSTLSMQEIFDVEEYSPEGIEASQSAQRPHQQRYTDYDHTRRYEWCNEDGDLLGKSDEHPSFTPPLSLYAVAPREAIPPASAVTESSNASSLASSGRNTPTSVLSAQTGGAASPWEGQGSASSNTGSMLKGRSHNVRPILYSAIGSLESINPASFQQMNKRIGAGKEFCRMGASGLGTLLPPVSTVTNQSKKPVDASRTLLAVDSHDLLPQNNNRSNNFNTVKPVLLNLSAKATPQSSNLRSTKVSAPAMNKESGQSLAPKNESSAKDTKPSNLRKSSSSTVKNENGKKKVIIKKEDRGKKKPVEMFRPSCDAYTPRIEKKRIEYRKAEMRTPVQKMATPMGTLSRPNFRDALRRVAMILHQHIVKIEKRFELTDLEKEDRGLFKKSMRELFAETNYCTPTYKCTMVRIPMARPGMVYGLRKIKTKPTIPSEEEIYEFAHQLFKSVQLSSECSIVCLIYIERLMEVAKVPLLANTWRPIFMCGLLLASKVWQDLSSWNIEFASVYPQYCLEAINRLELNFLRNVKWDLYISSSLYAKYYFALRSLVEKVDFRQRYNRMVGHVDSVAQSEALKIAKRTEQFKEEALLQLSRSM